MSTRRIALIHLAREQFDLMDPVHNVREITKQLLLLEDHLFHPAKRCVDCISKHLLTAEALAEEAITLDDGQDHSELLRGLPEAIRALWGRLQDESGYADAAQSIRQLRKNLVTTL
jgi:hypothetical protein